MLRYAFYLMGGILIANYLTIPLPVTVSIFILSLGYLIYRINRSIPHYRIHLGIAICIIVISLGVIRQTMWMHTSSQKTTDTSIRINTFPALKNHALRFEAIAVRGNTFDFFDAEQFIVSLNDTNANVAYGDVIRLTSEPLPVKENELAFQFDYASYLKSRGIIKTVTLCHAEKIPDHPVQAVWYRWINKSRIQFKRITEIIFRTSSSKALAESLLLGYKEDLDASTKDAFQKSGVSHLLAVSGMHTALIYEILFLLFVPLGSSQKRRFVFLVCALCVLVYFTILSGCSASVVRSAIMCSVVAIGYAFRKKGSGLNTLGISMFIILWCCPYQLWDLGFQLSVMAVFGILTLHAYVSRHFENMHIIPKYLLNATSITVCAQIMTLPIILYHFHSFPIYFIPANLILIPISTIALFLTMSSIFFAGTGIYFQWLFIATEWTIELFEKTTSLLASLPNSILYPISFSKIEFICVLILISIYLFASHSRRLFLTGLCSISFIWSGYRLLNEHRYLIREENIFICNNKKSAMIQINGFKGSVYTLVAFKDRDIKSLQEYFNLAEIQLQSIPSQQAGMIWKYRNNYSCWQFKSAAITTDKKLLYLFSYPKNKQNPLIEVSHQKSLNTKSIVYLK